MPDISNLATDDAVGFDGRGGLSSSADGDFGSARDSWGNWGSEGDGYYLLATATVAGGVTPTLRSFSAHRFSDHQFSQLSF